MQSHSDHVEKSKDILSTHKLSDAAAREKIKKHILIIGLHAADIGNPCKVWVDCKNWTYMLMEEWFRQGDQEKMLNIPVSPMMNRNNPNIPRGQIGFIEYIVKPLFENWNALFPQTSICLQNLKQNRSNWELLLNNYTHIADEEHNNHKHLVIADESQRGNPKNALPRFRKKKSTVSAVKTSEIDQSVENCNKPLLDLNKNADVLVISVSHESNDDEYAFKNMENSISIRSSLSNGNGAGNGNIVVRMNMNMHISSSKSSDVPFTPDEAKALHVYEEVMDYAVNNGESELLYDEVESGENDDEI